MIDLSIYESGNGGDFELLGNDLAKTDSFFNMVYLGLFGGNVEAITKGNEIPSEQRFDWWGNATLFENDAALQFNSETENLLNNIAINSSGISVIESTVKKDLRFLLDFAEIEVSVFLETVDRILINVQLLELSNQENKEFQFIWDASKKELIKSLIL